MTTRDSAPSGGWRLIHFLGLFGLMIALPALLFSAYLILRFAELQREAGEAALIENARTVSDSIDLQVSAGILMLRLLASAPQLEEGDFAGFHERAQEALSGTDAYVLLVDETAQQLLNTRVPFGTPLGLSSDPDHITQALTSGDHAVSGVFYGKVAQAFVYNVVVPAAADSGNHLALILTRNTETLRSLMEISVEPDGAITIVDAEGMVLARVGADGPAPGEPFPEPLADKLVGRMGAISAPGVSGEPMVIGYSTSRLTGWTTVVGLPVAAIEEPLGQSWQLLAGAGLLLVALTAALTFAMGRILAQPFESLASSAEALGRGETVALRRSRLHEADKAALALHNAGLERRRHEEHVELLMHELAHRAKNLLAVVQSIALLTGSRAKDIDGFLAAFRPRLVGFGRSIDLLAGRGWRGAPLRELVAAQLDAFSADAASHAEIEGPEIMLEPVAAERLGLALHELSTNASKYGAFSSPEGRVRIAWSIDGDSFRMSWQERGGPAPRGTQTPGFGHRLTVTMLSEALQGEVETSFAAEGFSWRLRCPLANIVAAAESKP